MKLSRNPKANPATQAHRIYEKLRWAILTGEIKGGERLVEMELAARMKVSRTPIRDALQKIAAEGLVYSIPRAGYIVCEMSAYDLQDLFTARICIEQSAAKLALEKITKEEMARLEANLKLSSDSIENELNGKMIDFDSEFHSILCGASRSSRLVQFSQMLRDHQLKYRIISLQDLEIARQALRGHIQIFEAVRAKNPKRVEETIRDHLETSMKVILQCLEREHQFR